ncbi:MAG TPA: tripartite tricarboxylate transporter substrate-binding protein [Noviherbaspirillum sp.]|uniref:tripartite tricarboxylate transporter substrate binding protein n=1 Tax=Noviherbaspirillum sp. TaxID=1926288 RepID=UPI002D541412|nr:tripartite tricarboxylate transporter substrate-binding protein [Noviherbaspirillum sp.]HYD94952.1 tripartite tricarboxylate transporter substrate-binding protein [Noviherbaspirillum sp.]
MSKLNRVFEITARAVALGVALAASASAFAQAPLELKIIAPAAPGGGWDGASRSLQQVMVATGAAKNVQVVNVPGAGGTVGLAQFVNNASGDGNQMMTMGITMLGAVLTNKSPVTLDSVTPIARLTADPLVVVVPANSPHKSIKDLAAALKADTSKVVWAGGSAGGADHILAGLIAKAAGGDASKLNYVPFSGGGEALAEMLGGRVAAGISGYNEFESMIKAGKLRAIALSTGKRLQGVDVPTLKEQGMDVELVNWRGIVGPPKISAEQSKALGAAVEKAVKSPEWAKVLKQRGWEDAYLPADQFAAFLKSDQARVKEVLTSIGLAK